VKIFCVVVKNSAVLLCVCCQCFDLIKQHSQDLWLWHKSQLEWYQYQDVVCRYCGVDGSGSYSQWTVLRKDWHLVMTP